MFLRMRVLAEKGARILARALPAMAVGKGAGRFREGSASREEAARGDRAQSS